MKKPKTVQTAFSIYDIKESLGQGGAGIVYRVTDEAGDEFAIKVLDSSRATKEKLKRFENEYRFCSQNLHPNIIYVYDSGITAENSPFFLMKRYDSSLRPMVGGLKYPDILKLFSKILNGVEAAHLKGVVHRDLKPENILIKNAGEELVIADFGIAHFTEEELHTIVETKENDRLANFRYAAPEQMLRGLSVDHRADIYALGLIFNELFTGQLAHGTNFKQNIDISSEHN